MRRVAFELEKNGKQSCDRNGFVKMADASDISLHSSLSKISDDTTASRKGLLRNQSHCIRFLRNNFWCFLGPYIDQFELISDRRTKILT